MSTRVDPTGPFRVLSHELLFEADFVRYGFDVHPDGNSFVMTRAEEPVKQEIVVVFNWFDELRRRMGR